MMDSDILPDVKPVSLLRAVAEKQTFPGLDIVGGKMARGLGALFGTIAVSVDAVSSTTHIFSAWHTEQPIGGLYCRFNLHPIKGHMALVFPPQLVAGMVDIFYGGDGKSSCAIGDITQSERLIIARFARAFSPLLGTSWAGYVEISPQFVGEDTDFANIGLRVDDVVVVQPFAVHDACGVTHEVSCLYPAEALRPITALTQSSSVATNALVDPVWSAKLQIAAMQIRLPMRSIFARPELPVSRLLALKPGDFIPVSLPKYLPITVAGRLFAHGSVGEAGGRTAIKIERIEEGNLKHE